MNRSGRFVERSGTRGLAALIAMMLCSCASVPKPASPPESRALAPPPTKISEVKDIYHGQTVADPYRWLEQTSDPEVQAWMKAQASYSRAVLDRIPGRDALLKRMFEVENSAPARVSRVAIVANGNVFFLRRDAGAAQHKLVMRVSVDAADQVVVDPTRFGPKFAIDFFFPSPDGRFVVYGISESGSDLTLTVPSDTSS